MYNWLDFGYKQPGLVCRMNAYLSPVFLEAGPRKLFRLSRLVGRCVSPFLFGLESETGGRRLFAQEMYLGTEIVLR